MRNLRSPFITLLIGSFTVLCAQQHNFISYAAKDGLPVSTILAIEQDSRNYLWIGTEGGGISRFDGRTFKTFTTKDGLASNIVYSILEDSKGDLWFGTDQGISVYNGFMFKPLRDELEISKSSITCLFEDLQQNIWIGTDFDGLRIVSRIENNGFEIRRITQEEGLSSNYVFDIHQDRKGRMWFALARGLDMITIKGNEFHIQNLGNSLSIADQSTTTLAQDHNGNMWVGTYDGGAVSFMEPDNMDSIAVVRYDHRTGLKDNRVWDIVEGPEGAIWIATDKGGINVISKEGIKYLTRKEGLPSDQIFRMYLDREENLWIGTYGSGLSKFLGFHFIHYGLNEPLGGFNISSVVEDQNGSFWLGTYESGLIQMQLHNGNPEFRYLNTNDGLAENGITSIIMDKDQTKWISYATSGVGKLGRRGLDHFTQQDEKLISNSVVCLLLDSGERLWCGTSGGITVLSDGIPVLNLDETMGIPSNKIQTIIEDKDREIWMGTLNGLMRFRWPDQLTFYDEVEGLHDLMIYSLAEDEKGNIWIGTFGGGLYKFDRLNEDQLPIHQIADDRILSSNNIYSMVFQNDSTLIVGTDQGFDKLILNEDQHVSYAKSYDESNGFFGIENNLNAIYKDQKGTTWFGTANGLTHYLPENESTNLQPPATYITSIRIRYEDVNWGNRLDTVSPWFNIPVDPVLKWTERHISIGFTGISMSNPEKIRYKSRMIGLDERWSPPSRVSEVIYQNLHPGQYEFQVIAENENGIWNETPPRFLFSIKAPLWRQGWFYLLIGLALLVSVILLIRNRERKLIKKNRELESKVKERTREIRAQKDEIEAQRDEIEAQRDELENQRDIVISQKQEITDSIYYAQRIQRAVLPHEGYLDEIMPEYIIIYKPRDIVSGDFYWVKKVKNYLVIVAADCTGHGVPGAFMSMLGITLLNEHVGKSRFDQAGEILNRLRKKVKVMMAQEGTIEDQKDGMDMAIVIYNLDTKDFQFAGAYNPLYLLRKKGAHSEALLEQYASISNTDHTLFELKGDRQPIGVHFIETDFTTYSIKLEPGDVFYIFSDGFVDQFGGEHRKKFKSLNFKKLLLENQDKPLERQKQIIEDTFEEWRGHYEQIDDICIVGVKI